MIVYVTVAGVADALISVCAILFPFPPEKPEALPEVNVAVHENVVPPVALDNTIFVEPVVQILCEEGVAMAVGFGFTVTRVVNGAEQLFASETSTEYVSDAAGRAFEIDGFWIFEVKLFGPVHE